MSNLQRYAAPLLALQLAGGCSAQTQEQPPAQQADAASEQQERRLVLAFGDSLYAGYGMGKAQSFPAALQRELAQRGINAEVVNAGVSGDTTFGGRRRLAATLDRLAAKPDLVVLGLGANDALIGVPAAEVRRNFDAMLAELEQRGIPVLLTGLVAPPAFKSPYFAQYEAIIPEVAERHGAKLEPSLLEGVLTRREYLLADGVHPNPKGTQRMAERVAPLAAEALEGAS
ncbi:MAG TPA: arylesterase [Sphingomicrobium sp.]|nr:arylesterase [Sphingomicrobium sp.]